jgi:hypothetical protein
VLVFTQQRPPWATSASAVALARLALGDQPLGDLGLSLQPGEPWLLVHASQLLAGGQPLAHDRDDLAVGGRLLLQSPAGGWPDWALPIEHTSFAESSTLLPKIPTCQSVQTALKLEAAVDALGESGPHRHGGAP